MLHWKLSMTFLSLIYVLEHALNCFPLSYFLYINRSYTMKMSTTVWTDVTHTQDVNYMSVCGGGRMHQSGQCSPPISDEFSNNAENTCVHTTFKSIKYFITFNL